MKVALVTSFPQDPDCPQGGVEAVSVNLVRGLAALDDLDIHVVTLDHQVPSAQSHFACGATVHRLPAPRGSVLFSALTGGRRLIYERVCMLNPDVVHSHDTYGLMAKGLPYPRIFTIHGFIYGDTLVSGVKLPRLRSLIWKRVETAGWADQTHIVSISPYVRERISNIVRGTIHDIENPISEGFFNSTHDEKHGVIFSAAVISPRKNTLALIDAVRILVEEGKNVQLRIAGKIADPKYGQVVEERIKKNSMEGKVLLLGPINADKVKTELEQAAVFALVSLEENAPLGIEEAMAVGVPVVTSNRCGMPYMVRHGETGFLVNPNDPADIALRIGQLVENTNLRRSMGERSRVIAKERFHPESVAFRTREVYRESIRSRK